MVTMANQDCSQAAELLREALDREQVKAKDLPQVHQGRAKKHKTPGSPTRRRFPVALLERILEVDSQCCLHSQVYIHR